MFEKVMQKIKNIIKTGPQKGANHNNKSIKNKVEQMMEKKRPRLIWYGGPLQRRNTSKFKDNSADDNLPKEKKKIQKDEIQVGGSETHANTPRAPSGLVRIYWAYGSPRPVRATGPQRDPGSIANIYMITKFQMEHWDRKSNVRVFRPSNHLSGHRQ